MADAVRHRTKEGFTVLEIGGGIGALQIELLRDGASSATNVELSRSYEDVARELLVEAGVAERVERRVGDVLADPSSVAPADAVILQRVVCCYPHAEGLVRLAAQRARRVLVLTFPVDRWWTRAAIGLANVWPRLRGWKFRAYVHPTHVVVTAAAGEGLALAERRVGLVWQMLVLARDA
ncbi:MAG: class I SAM-dependent methyltransferase [Chloroflexi bacterium]|nr:MAG: class I SAM-dependent methyltransferase [Chloroflexota bacterium]